MKDILLYSLVKLNNAKLPPQMVIPAEKRFKKTLGEDRDRGAGTRVSWDSGDNKPAIIKMPN